MFGNVTELKDLALPPVEEINKFKEKYPPRQVGREDFKYDSKDIDKLFALIPLDPKERKYAYDVVEFNAIMESLSQMVSHNSRRWFKNAFDTIANAAISLGKEAVTLMSQGGDLVYDIILTILTWFNPYDKDYYRGREDSADAINLEHRKANDLDKLMVCLLIHTRYRVDHAIRQRKNLVHLKAYRLGYLFNRLRRVKYMQAKIVHTAHQERIAAWDIRPAFSTVHDTYGWQSVRWFEKMVHLDQDMRDLCTLVYDTVDEKVIEPKLNPRQMELNMLSG